MPRPSVIALLGCFLACGAPAAESSSSFAPGPAATVSSVGGIPTLFIDGVAQSVPGFSSYGPQERDYAGMSKTGIHILQFDANAMGGDGFSSDISPGPDRWDFSQFDSRMDLVLRADPDARVLIRLFVGGTPQWWNDAHPEAMERTFDDQTTFTSLGRSIHGFPSLAAPEFRTAVGDGLNGFLAHLEAKAFAPHVAGFILTGTLTQEWYPELPGFDQYANRPPMLYSKATLRAFQAWARQSYHGDIKALSSAWKTHLASFEDITVPPPAAFQSHLQPKESGAAAKTFRTESAAVEDFWRFYSAQMVDTIDYFAQRLKTSRFGNRFVGAIYGYMNEFAGIPSFSHNALKLYLASPNLDGMLVEPSYYKRNGPAGAELERSPYESVRLAGKLLMADDDAGTIESKAISARICVGYKAGADAGNAHLAEVWKNNCQPDQLENNAREINIWPDFTVEKNLWALTRFAGFSLTNGLFMSYFSQAPGAYDNAALLQGVAKINAAMRDAARYPKTSAAEVLVVSDEDSNNYVLARPRSEDVKDLLGSSLSAPRFALRQMGAPYDHILLDDLSRIDAGRYKLVIFLNAYKLTSAQRTRIRSDLMSKNRVLMFNYAAGLFDESGARQPGDITQIKLDTTSLRTKIQAPGIQLASPQHPLGQRLAATGIQTVAPKFLPECCETFFAAEPAADALGLYPGTQSTSLALRRLGDWTSLWSITPDLPAAYYREIARFAGVHIYDEQNDTLYVNRSFLTIEATTEGQKTLTLPFKAEIHDQVTNEPVAHASSTISLTMKLGETRILRIEPAGN